MADTKESAAKKISIGVFVGVAVAIVAGLISFIAGRLWTTWYPPRPLLTEVRTADSDASSTFIVVTNSGEESAILTDVTFTVTNTRTLDGPYFGTQYVELPEDTLSFSFAKEGKAPGTSTTFEAKQKYWVPVGKPQSFRLEVNDEQEEDTLYTGRLTISYHNQAEPLIIEDVTVLAN